MRKGWLLVVVMVGGCSLLEAQSPEDLRCRRPELVVPPEGPVPYAFICLDGRPWRPDSVLGFMFDADKRYIYLGTNFILSNPTADLPFYEARLRLDLYEKPLQTTTIYYLFNSNPFEREKVTNGELPEIFLGRSGSLSEIDGDLGISSYWIAREDSLRSWVRFSRIDTVQTEPFLLVFYEGRFEMVLSPFHRSIRSRYPDAKLHFQGRFRVPAVTWNYFRRCWRERNCLRVEVRTL
ncbi:hypothetical protein [Rhodothermus profundi]|uniref:Uncharacterized protein n=1 Tax=Rhodothermus profundi TaxID=633813 RepID=A0A1M6XSR4_9BACT|nr:hypothetical protein [Rhodothermus profundi]SHL08948.1 hypothetical protein SAMN04488087_2697 [Rhodothermus profundi]